MVKELQPSGPQMVRINQEILSANPGWGRKEVDKAIARLDPNLRNHAEYFRDARKNLGFGKWATKNTVTTQPSSNETIRIAESALTRALIEAVWCLEDAVGGRENLKRFLDDLERLGVKLGQ